MIPTWYSDSDNMLDYDLVRLIGKGGFSSCYEAVDKNKQKLAMKVIAKSSAKKSQRGMIDREIDIQRTLKHENILKLVHSFEDSNNFYILTSLCPKETIQIHFNRCGPFSSKTSRYFVFQCFQAVSHLQDFGIIHRDLKPSNFFLDEIFTVKLGDFGLAIHKNDVDKQKSFVSGTIGFVAPEVVAEKDVRLENDLWSFGCTVHSIYDGRPPFETDEQTTTGELTFKEGFEPEGRELVEFILKVKPEDRPTCEEIGKHEYFTRSAIIKPSMSELTSKSAPLKITTIRKPDQRVRNRMLAEALRQMALDEGLKP